MKYALLDYVQEAGWTALSRDEQARWLGVYRDYMQAMRDAGVLKAAFGLLPSPSATTVRMVDDKPQVLDGPYPDTKEQLGGLHLIEVDDLDAALAWAARSPTALHGSVVVRPVHDETFLTRDITQWIKPE